MSRHMDSRKNRSSSTTETRCFVVMPPLAVRSKPASAVRDAVALRGTIVFCAEDATGVMPAPRKLWLISLVGEGLRRLEPKADELCLCAENGAVHGRGIGTRTAQPGHPAN